MRVSAPATPIEPELVEAEPRQHVGLTALVAAVLVAPLFILPYPAVQDLPNVAAILATLLREGSPSFDARFTVDWSFGPYTAFYVVGFALAKLVGADLAARLLAGIPMIAIPALAALLGSRLREGGGLTGLLTLPLLYTELYFVGFHPFLHAVTFALVAAVALESHLRSGERSELALTVLAFELAWLAHPSASLAMVATGGSVFALRRAERARVVRAALALGAFVGLGALHTSLTQDVDLAHPAIELTLGTELRAHLTLPGFALDAVQSIPRLAAPSFACVFAIVVVRRAADAVRRLPQGWFALLPSSALAAASVILPFGAGPVVWLDTRVAVLAWLALILVGGAPESAWLRQRVTALALVCATFGAALVGQVAFSRSLAPLDRLFRRIPEDAFLVGVTFGREREALAPFYVQSDLVPTFSPAAHAVAWFHLDHGGESPSMTFHPSLAWIPLRMRDVGLGSRFPIVTPFVPNRTLRGLTQDSTGIDFVLLRRPGPEHLAAARTFGTVVARDGEYALVEVR